MRHPRLPRSPLAFGPLVLAPLLLAPALLAGPGCAADPGPSVDYGDGNGGGSGDGSGDGTTGFHGERCAMHPAPDMAAQELRVGPDGVVWRLDEAGLVWRYTRDDDPGDEGDACSLTGEVVLGDGTLEDVQDLELDAQGRAYALVFFDEVRRLTPEGVVDLACEVEAGHALAPVPDGSRVYVWPIGAEELAWVDVGDDACAASPDAVALARPIDTVGQVAGDALMAGAFDVANAYAPGFLLSLGDGAVRSDVGEGDDDLVAFADLVEGADGWWGVDSVSGDLWRLDAEGRAVRPYAAGDLLPVEGDPDPYLFVHSIAYSPTGRSYVAGGFMDLQGVWELAL